MEIQSAVGEVIRIISIMLGFFATVFGNIFGPIITSVYNLLRNNISIPLDWLAPLTVTFIAFLLITIAWWVGGAARKTFNREQSSGINPDLFRIPTVVFLAVTMYGLSSQPFVADVEANASFAVAIASGLSASIFTSLLTNVFGRREWGSRAVWMAVTLFVVFGFSWLLNSGGVVDSLGLNENIVAGIRNSVIVGYITFALIDVNESKEPKKRNNKK